MTGPDNAAVDRLVHFRCTEAPVLSAYVAIPPDPGEIRGAEARVRSVLKPVREFADSDGLSHAEKTSLRADVDRVLGLAGRAPEFKGRAVAVFACSHMKLYEEMVLPRLVRDRAVVDATPYLRPLLAVLDESHRYCVAVVDRQRAWLYEFFMGRLEEEHKVRDRAPRRRNFGGRQGLDEHTARNRAEELARRHFRTTAESVQDLVVSTGSELLILGGHEQTVAEFLPFLPHDLRPKVAGTFVVDPNTMSPGKVREHADRLVDAYEREEETRLVSDTLGRVAGGFAASGVEQCLLAANEQAVQLLLIQDEEEVVGRACDNCGWLGLDGDECPVCSRPTRPTPDVIDEMAAAVIDAGGRVEHVYAETDLTGHLVAATLRFPVTPSPGGD